MSFDWSQFLDISRKLEEQARNAPAPIQEACFRASISRAYYAVFGRARDYLRRHDRIREVLTDSVGERINIHQYVREKFMNQADQNYQEVGATLDRLSTYRNAADYDLVNPLLNKLPVTTQTVLKSAGRALAKLQEMQRT